jgi:hypothetical protein
MPLGKMQKQELDRMFKETGHQKPIFPVFVRNRYID